jgi:hypothetical protein
LFEKVIKDIQQKEAPRDLPKVGMQTHVKAHLTKNFSSDTKNQFFRPTKSTRPLSFINFTRSTKPIGFTKPTRFIGSIRYTSDTGFISSTESIINTDATKTTRSF